MKIHSFQWEPKQFKENIHLCEPCYTWMRIPFVSEGSVNCANHVKRCPIAWVNDEARNTTSKIISHTRAIISLLNAHTEWSYIKEKQVLNYGNVLTIEAIWDLYILGKFPQCFHTWNRNISNIVSLHHKQKRNTIADISDAFQSAIDLKTSLKIFVHIPILQFSSSIQLRVFAANRKTELTRDVYLYAT